MGFDSKWHVLLKQIYSIICTNWGWWLMARIKLHQFLQWDTHDHNTVWLFLGQHAKWNRNTPLWHFENPETIFFQNAISVCHIVHKLRLESSKEWKIFLVTKSWKELYWCIYQQNTPYMWSILCATYCTRIVNNTPAPPGDLHRGSGHFPL